jgi:hypothetical protein
MVRPALMVQPGPAVLRALMVLPVPPAHPGTGSAGW